MSRSRRRPVPTVLRLVQTAVLGRWRATEDDLYREVARLTEAGPGREILVSGCGAGLAAEWLAVRTGASVTGVDPDLESVAQAEALGRETDAAARLHYTQGVLDDLPHETAVFDIAVGEPALSAAADPAAAVAELARVVRPLGSVVLLQPTWTSEITEGTRDILVERLGLRPHLLVEWKQMMRDAGIVELQVEDWTDGGASGRGVSEDAVPALAWHEKARIAGAAWRRSGWRAARGAVARETRLMRELSRERALGFQLIKGVKWPHARDT